MMKNPLSDLLNNRSKIIEVFVIAFILGFGINTLSLGLSSSSWYTSNAKFIGMFIVLISFLYLILRLLRIKKINKNIEGFIVYDENQNSLITVPRYSLSENISRYMNSAFVENGALKKLWDKEPLSTDPMSYDKETKQWIRREIKTHSVISEAVEYFVLSQLTTHLIDYFNNEKFKENKTQTFMREQVPDVLLSNRFFELFSKQLEDREHFSESGFLENDDNEGVLYGAYSDSGAYYERFELELPRKSKLRRHAKNISIETNRFVLKIIIKFDGTRTNLPSKFERSYLKCTDILEINCYSVDINIRVKFKFITMISLSGWHYYSWIDSFLRSLEEDVSKEFFFEKINWETIMTILETKGNQRYE